MSTKRAVAWLEGAFKWLPVAIAAYVFFRFVQLAFYAQPQADDFDYLVLFRRYGFFGAQVKWYYGWNGRYFFNAATTAAMALVDPTRNYFLIPIAMFALMLWAHQHAFQRANGGQVREAILASFVATAFVLVSSPVRADAYYWATGVPLYPLANASLVFFLAAAARLYVADDAKARRTATAILIALAFVTIGCNETSMLVLDATAFALFAAAILGKRNALHWGIVLAACVAFTIFVIKAPGNAVRESFMVHRHDMKVSVDKTTEQTQALIKAWTLQPLLLVTTLLAWPYAGRAADRARARFPRLGAPWLPVLVALGTAGIVWISVFPSWWSKGTEAIPRTLVISQFAFFCGWTVTVALLASQLEAKWREGFPRIAVPILGVALLFAFATHDTFEAVTKDLKVTAPAYRTEMRLRYRAIREAKARGEKDVVVEPVKSPPSQLFIIDLFACTEGWPNSSYAEAFGLDTIRPRGAPMGSCGPVPPQARAVVNPYSIHLFRNK